MVSFTESNINALLWGPINCSNEKDDVGFSSVVFLWFRSGWNLFEDRLLYTAPTQLGEKHARFPFCSSQDPEEHNMQFKLFMLLMQISQLCALYMPLLQLKIYSHYQVQYLWGSRWVRLSGYHCANDFVLSPEPKVRGSSNWTEQDICVCWTTFFSGRRPA